ncbi:hypothetical protein HOLleu_42959 [Holothuria leucospilota]|uniref:Uncharacterized protein n=1 Tax=Holothuria leucospilota TaxID=206669 RepID=A0A9Q0Y9W5_HOLLE|nr:hypothetical protein HOLleu_42959 [Holothuria leucospilota]
MSPQLRHTLQRGVFPSDKLRLHLIQVIFDYMWQFGSHPTRLHYEQIAQLLVKEYPCLAQTNVPAAKPYDYWKLKLSDKFRNERKSMGSASLTGNKVKKLPPEPNPGEDTESIIAHIRWMEDEFKKRTPDWESVKKLMGITFEDRRKDVSNMLIPVMKEKYPSMFTVTEVV